jgi:hypothetical protein
MNPRIRRLVPQEVGAAGIPDGPVQGRMAAVRIDGWAKIP